MEVQENTQVEQLDLDIDSMLGISADSVMLPADKETKPSVFSRSGNPDVSFLDRKNELENEEPEEEEKKEIEKVLAIDDTQVSEKKPRYNKDGVLQLTNKLIEKKLLIPFDDEKPLEDYSLQDFEELLEANFNERERKAREQVPAEFFEALPEELQYAAQYVANGGTDLKALFRTLASVEEVRSMSPDDDNDARTIVRSYLQATRFGTAEEIEEEINSWDDLGKLNEKAKKFKPKLDAMTEQQIQYQLQEQEERRKMQEQQAQMYMDNVYRTLEPGELNGLKLDRKTQNMLFSGLVQPAYPSISGRPTNLLGHLLEKHQYVEPNHSLIAEALWLLADPDGYKAKVRENTKKEVVKETVRQLKSEESRKTSSSYAQEEESYQQPQRQTIARPSKNFFKR